MRSKYHIINNDAVYFITSTTINWLPLLKSETYFHIIISALNFSVVHKNLRVYAWVILNNHFHIICKSPQLSRTIQSIKRHTARKIIQQLQADNQHELLFLLSKLKKKYKTTSTYQVWQEGFHPQIILNQKTLLQKINYIHLNPVKMGLVEKPEQWQFSSARYYLSNKESLVILASLAELL